MLTIIYPSLIFQSITAVACQDYSCYILQLGQDYVHLIALSSQSTPVLVPYSPPRAHLGPLLKAAMFSLNLRERFLPIVLLKASHLLIIWGTGGALTIALAGSRGASWQGAVILSSGSGSWLPNTTRAICRDGSGSNCGLGVCFKMRGQLSCTVVLA